MAGARPLYEGLRDDGAETYYTESLRAVIELHIPYLLTANRSTVMAIPPNVAYQNEHDFYSLLLVLSIPRTLHWATLRLNGMTNPSEYRRDMLAISVPNPDIIDRLKSINTTVHKI